MKNFFAFFRRLRRLPKKQKQFAILGPRASGKTTFIRLLMHGELPEDYIATSRPIKVSGAMVRLDSLRLQILPLMDLPGDLASHRDWEEEYKAAHVVCYLCDASRLHAGDEAYAKSVTADMRKIGDWFDSRKVKPQVFLIATHCDLIPKYAQLAFEDRTQFTDEFWRLPITRNLVHLGRGSKNIHRLAGSLLVKRESDSLIGDILRQVTA